MLAELPQPRARPRPDFIPVSPSRARQAEEARKSSGWWRSKGNATVELAALKQQLAELAASCGGVAEDPVRGRCREQIDTLRTEHNDTKSTSRAQQQARAAEDKLDRTTEQLQRMGGLEQERAAMATVIEAQQKTAAAHSGESIRMACDQLEGRLVRALQDKCQSLQGHIDAVEGKMLTESMLSRHTKDLAAAQDQAQKLENRLFTVESSLSQNGIADALQSREARSGFVHTRLGDREGRRRGGAESDFGCRGTGGS